MAHIKRTAGGHIARTSTGHIARCPVGTVNTCKCIEGGSEVDRKDVMITLGGSLSPTALTLCAAGPTEPLDCPSPSILASYTVACGHSGGSILASNFVCAATAGLGSYYYHAQVVIDYVATETPTIKDFVRVSVTSGYFRSTDGGITKPVFVVVQNFVDVFSYTTRANCTSLGSAVRTWISGEAAANNCCLINGVTTSATVLV